MEYGLEAYNRRHAEDMVRELFDREVSFTVKYDPGYRPENGVGYGPEWTVVVDAANRRHLDEAYTR